MFIAVGLATIITLVVYNRLRANVARPQLVDVVAATKDVPAGAALAAEDVNLVKWPASVPLTGSFSKVEDVVGRPLIYPVSKGEPVMDRDLGVPGSGFGLSVKIPEGMRATSVRSNEVVGVAGFLYPGSHVDVLGTFRPTGETNPVTQTLLQNVEVLTAGQTIQPDPTGKPQTVNVVTLLLNPEDSQKLLMASTQATIQFVLRNGADQKQEKVNPTRFDDLVATGRPAPVKVAGTTIHHVRLVKQVIPQVAPPPPFVVEVIQGQTRKDEKFTNSNSEESSGKNQ